MQLRKSIYTCFLLVLVTESALASHMVGVDITYDCVNACTTRLHLKAYRDCSGVTTMQNTINWSAPGCTPPAAITNWSSPITREITPICPSASTQCTTPGATITGVEEYYWTRDYDICSGTPCVYHLEWSDCCRNPIITSLSNPGSQGITTSGTTINTALGSCNNSPKYTTKPFFMACSGSDYDVHQGAIDPDGDSLVYSMGTCYQALSTPVAYSVGYSVNAPLGPSWNVSMDPQTGMLHLQANPGNPVVGVLCIQVDEYRNGNLIGTIQRDIQIIVTNCPANNNPVITGITNLSGGATVVGNDVYLPAPGPFCFDLTTSDLNLTQNLRLFWHANATGATFSDATNGSIVDTISGTGALPPVGRFCWAPPSNGTYQFQFRVKDDACPAYGFADKLITIHVGSCGGSTATATPGNCPSVQFSANTCMGGTVTYLWSGGGGLTSNAASFSYNYPVAGNFPWQVIVSNGTVSDTIQGTVTVGGTPIQTTLVSGLHFVSPCTGQLYDTLTVTGPWTSYAWSTGATTASLPVFIGGTYGVTVTAVNGCTYSDAPTLFWSEPDVYGVVTTSTGAPLQNQRILLVQNDTVQQALWASDSTWTDSLGYYFFCNVTDTMAFLKATPNAFYYPTEMPTYADTALFWSGANLFYPLAQLPFQHDFSTLFGTNPGGPGFIGGLITQGANKTGNIGDPVPGLRVFLRDQVSGDVLGYRDTDINGYFSFPAIPLGTYEIVPDKPLVSTVNVPVLTLTAQTPVLDSLDFQLHHTWLELVQSTAIVPTTPSLNFILAPNPFDGIARLRLDLPNDAHVEIRILDVLGKEVEQAFSGELVQGTHTVGLGGRLPRGAYWMEVRVNGMPKWLRVVKQ